MAPKSASDSTTNSGIRKLSNGESIIPASTRADGTVRKEIRVKPGYRPPEDVEVYKNRTAEAWKNRGKGGVPGAEGLVSDKKDAAPSATANKNAKRREARKRAAAAAQDGTEDAENGDGAPNGHEAAQPDHEGAATQEEHTDPEAEKAKEARKLAKKLRQAHELQAKKDKGDSLLPEQLAKVIKINELIRQLDALGFDTEGERKKGGEAVK